MMKLPRRRLKVAWKAKAVRHKSLLDDLSDPPVWFSELVGMFSANWRVGRLGPSRDLIDHFAESAKLILIKQLMQ